MAMAWIWTGMVAASVVFGLVNGTIGAVSGAAMEGAGAAVELCLSMAGIMCLWNGVMAVMKVEEAAEAARLVGAKRSIPYHVTARNDVFFDRTLAEQFDVENRLILDIGETLLVE